MIHPCSGTVNSMRMRDGNASRSRSEGRRNRLRSTQPIANGPRPGQDSVAVQRALTEPPPIVRFALPAQPVDATQALNLSAGVSNSKSYVAVRLAAIPADFPAHRRRRAAQQHGHRSCRLMRCNASGNLLAFRERQCQPRAMSRCGTNAPCGATWK